MCGKPEVWNAGRTPKVQNAGRTSEEHQKNISQRVKMTKKNQTRERDVERFWKFEARLLDKLGLRVFE